MRSKPAKRLEKLYRRLAKLRAVCEIDLQAAPLLSSPARIEWDIYRDCMFAVKASLERLQHLEDTTPKTEENPVNHDEEKKP